MIRGLHGLFYTSQPDEMRAFLRDKMQLPHTDVGQGWLIFDLPEADLGVHPIDESGQPPSGTHDISFYCDDIQGTVAGMKQRGVEFDGEIADHGYGFVTHFTMPGGARVQLYEPKYSKAKKPAAKPKAKAKAKARPAPKKKELSKAERKAAKKAEKKARKAEKKRKK
jgi:predicted enzyme related to lactoylglutathione lyase